MPSISRWGRFARDNRGNVALLFGLSIVPIVLAVGLAADYGRALTVRERMADAADASALAIGSWTGLTQAQLKVKAQQYFDANYSTSAIGTAGALHVSFPGDDIVVQVSGNVPTTFLKLANIDSIDVGASSTVTKKQRKIELALVLDTTGSMDSSGKMDALKSAAKNMVQTMFKGSTDDIKIAVVPFSGAVNIGSANKDSGWIDKGTYPNMSDIAKEDHDFDRGESSFTLLDDLRNTSWSGCVRERGGSYELSDDPPVSSVRDSLFAPYFAPDEPDSDHSDWGAWYNNSYIDDGDCGTNKKNDRTSERCQAFTGKYWRGRPSGDGPSYNCPPSVVQPLTNVQSTVETAIKNLSPKGSTVIPAGLLWGWRVLSPGEPYSQGSQYNSDKWVKALVLLTDGENSVNGGSNGHNKSVYNAFGYANKGHLGSTSGWNANATLDDKTLAVCSSIKAKGIQLYTIGFKVNDNTKEMLRKCATEPDMAYVSPTNAQLASIFDSIAQGLSELRIAY